MVLMVVEGSPDPEIICPTSKPAVLLTAVTTGLPAVVLPWRRKESSDGPLIVALPDRIKLLPPAILEIVEPPGMPLPLTGCPAARPDVLHDMLLLPVVRVAVLLSLVPVSRT